MPRSLGAFTPYEFSDAVLLVLLFLLFPHPIPSFDFLKTSAPTPEPVPQRVEDKVLLTRSTVLARWGLRAYG